MRMLMEYLGSMMLSYFLLKVKITDTLFRSLCQMDAQLFLVIKPRGMI